MAKTTLKGILTIAIVIVLAVAGMAIWNHFTSGSAVGTATTAITGSTKLGDLVGKVSSGQNLTDEEIKSDLALTDKAYDTLKSAAASEGVDITNSAQLKKIAAKNAGNVGQAQDILNELQVGNITGDQAVAQLKNILVLD